MQHRKIRNNTFLITGTRKGIGRYLAEYYLKLGKIVIGCSRSEPDLNHKNYNHLLTDVGNENDVINLFDFVRKLDIGLDCAY